MPLFINTNAYAQVFGIVMELGLIAQEIYFPTVLYTKLEHYLVYLDIGQLLIFHKQIIYVFIFQI